MRYEKPLCAVGVREKCVRQLQTQVRNYVVVSVRATEHWKFKKTGQKRRAKVEKGLKKRAEIKALNKIQVWS